MKFGTAGKWEAALSINGTAVALSAHHLKDMEVKAGIHRPLPTLTLSIDDVGHEILNKIGPRAGATLSVYMSDSKERRGVSPYSGSFRALGSPKAHPIPRGFTLTFEAMLNNLAWLMQVSDFHKKTTSSGMIGALASKAGLKFEGDATADAMTWLPNRQPLAKYASMVASRGFAGAGSVMLMAVTDKGVLRYKNAASIIGKGGRSLGGTDPDAMIPIRAMYADSSQTLQTPAGGGGATTIGESLDGALKELNKIDFASVGGFAGIPGIGDIVGKAGSRITSFGIDAGNTHKKYDEALNQNTRGKAAWGDNVDVLVDEMTGLDVLDPVTIHAISRLDGSPLPYYSGSFVVTNTVKAIKNDYYIERIRCTRQG